MAQAKGLREVAWIDCPGGGQVEVQDNLLVAAHMTGPNATSLFDISDPSNPRLLSQLMTKDDGFVHSHKVQLSGNIMLTNYEAQRYLGEPPSGFRGGLNVFDISDPENPRELAFWPCDGSGIHRFTFDGRYAYISPEIDGYVGNIVMILDLENPANPKEVSRWWMPGQWTAGGETPNWEGRAHRVHHPIRYGNRLYVSYWHGGFVILDISDITRPTFVSGLDWSPPFACPTHTCLPIPFDINGRRILLVTDEDVNKTHAQEGSFLWLVDITEETRPVPFSTFQVEGRSGVITEKYEGCHQPDEVVRGTEIPVAWFTAGLRLIDIANPHAIKELAYFVPDAPPGQEKLQSNDVCADDRGYIYLLDRIRGLHIVERTE